MHKSRSTCTCIINYASLEVKDEEFLSCGLCFNDLYIEVVSEVATKRSHDGLP